MQFYRRKFEHAQNLSSICYYFYLKIVKNVTIATLVGKKGAIFVLPPGPLGENIADPTTLWRKGYHPYPLPREHRMLTGSSAGAYWFLYSVLYKAMKLERRTRELGAEQ